MRKSKLIIGVICMIAVICTKAIKKSITAFDRFTYFDTINVNMSWSIITSQQTIYIELIAPIKLLNSWIAFGISDNGGMIGADIALVSLYHNKIFDLHSNDFILPIMDKIQNWKLLYLKTTANDYTIIQIQ
eukprot:158838_1